MPTEESLRSNPFEPQALPDGTTAYYDPDNGDFYHGPADPDGCDEFDEYATSAELVAST